MSHTAVSPIPAATYARSLATGRTRSVGWALAATLAALAWQAATVHFNYGGNWTALFITGQMYGVPPTLASEHVYVVPNAGWDGQFYHVIAHDPLLRNSSSLRFLDFQRLRYRRILVPGLAYLLALGDQSRIDSAYRLVILGFVLLGCYLSLIHI